MLVRVALLPEVFDEAPQSADSRDWYYPAAVGLLHDLSDNCVISVATGNVVRDGILAAVRKWPPKYASQGLQLLARLETQNRFALHGDSVLSTCGHPHCGTVAALVGAQSPFAVITSKAHSSCMLAAGLKPPLVTLPSY